MTVASESIPEVKIKTCRKCGILFKDRNCKACKKIRSAAWNKANKNYMKAYREANPEKIKAIQDKWQLANAEKEALRKSLWQENNPDKVRASSKAWQEANPEKFRESQAKWKGKNPDTGRIYSHNRRARKKTNGGKLSAGLSDRLFKLQKGKCACCKKPLGDDFHLDHIMPLSKGGSNTDDNIQLLTQTCNQQKHAKDPIEFMQSRGFLL